MPFRRRSTISISRSSITTGRSRRRRRSGWRPWPGSLNPYYTYGAILLAAPAWAIGTALGIIAGNLLPLRAVSALSVALYGMFLAIIIPPARKSRVVAALVAISFALSFVCNYLPGISALSEGTRTILLTVLISSAAAVLFPVNPEEQEAEHDA